MLCNGCSCEVSDELDICPECGKIIEASEQAVDAQPLTPAKDSDKDEDLGEQADPVAAEEFVSDVPTFQPLLGDKQVNQSEKSHPILGAVVAVLVVAAVSFGIFTYANHFGFEGLSWVEDYGDYGIEYLTQSVAELAFDFSDTSKLDQVKITTSCGEAQQTDMQIQWDLTECVGEASINLAHKNKKISKSYKVLDPVAIRNSALNLEASKIDEADDTADEDGDGLSNAKESKLNSDPEEADSDSDGLADKYELEESNTNPYLRDSDDDGLDDYNELVFEQDPNNADTKSNGLKDGERPLEYKVEKDDITIKVSGSGNLANSDFIIQKAAELSNRAGLVPVLYNIYLTGEVSSANIEIPYSDALLEVYDLDEDKLGLFMYNPETSLYDPVNSVVNKTSQVLLASIDQSGLFVVGDKSQITDGIKSDALIIVDNSWSHYSSEQYKQLTSSDWPSDSTPELAPAASDAEGKRITLLTQLAEELSEKGFHLGLSEFRDDYVNAQKIGSSISKVKRSLNKMKGSFITKTDGTGIANALEQGIKEFGDKSDSTKYIILVTDGQDASLAGRAQQIIQSANSQNIKICAVGFGDGVYNAALSQIAKSTHCGFFSSTLVDGLKEPLNEVRAQINHGLEDTDGDGVADSVILANSGFMASRDGFSFANYRSEYSENGHCYGMALFAELYYLNKLPRQLGAQTPKIPSRAISHAYSLDDSFFANNPSLYSFRFTTKDLKYMLGYQYFGESEPKSLYTMEGEMLKFAPNISDNITNTGIYNITSRYDSTSIVEQRLKHGTDYRQIEVVALKYTDIEKNLDQTDAAVFNAIYAFLNEKDNISRISSGASAERLQQVASSLSASYANKLQSSDTPAFIALLEAALASGDSVPFTINGGKHTVNAIDISRSIQSPQTYNVGIYDNNYPGKRRYVQLDCAGGIICRQVANSYYDEASIVEFRMPLLQDTGYFK